MPPDPMEPLPLPRRELGTGPRGLSAREAARRLAVYGPNEVRRKTRTSLGRDLLRQLVHPLALLLWAAAALLQERQAEQAVETLAKYLPEHSLVIRDGRPTVVGAGELVPGDLIVLEEGAKVPADARLTEGGIEVDLSMLNGESTPAERLAGPGLVGAPLLQEPNLVFSGTICTGGQARGIVFATGNHTELGRIAALSQRTRRDPSPLEQQVKKVAWLIAAVAVAMGGVFLAAGVAVACR
ncbi:cation-transporting P-type ATPase [Streptomyces sp. PvR034]|uniref:P-type ATPase n=1 Tax=Streptomyces sp. PvR034 TaxID=3156401 RepID=UPI0033947C6A